MEDRRSVEFISIRMVFEMRYDAPDFNDSVWDVFSALNIPLNAWPYLREYVQNVTQRLGIPPLTLPLYQV